MRSEAMSPGRAVTAMAAISLKVVSASVKACSITGSILRTCSRAATSGTTPPVARWRSICDAITFDKTFRPSCTTAADVSSHEVSMDKMGMNHETIEVETVFYTDSGREIKEKA